MMRLLTLLSALLVIGVIALAWRSSRQTDLLAMPWNEKWIVTVHTSHGRLNLALHGNVYSVAGHRVRWFDTTSELDHWLEGDYSPPPDRSWGLGGVRYVHLPAVRYMRAEAHVFRLPLWMIAFFASLPLLRAVHRRRRTAIWRSDGRCVVCGYDLRASPDRCPECATPVAEETR